MKYQVGALIMNIRSLEQMFGTIFMTFSLVRLALVPVLSLSRFDHLWDVNEC